MSLLLEGPWCVLEKESQGSRRFNRSRWTLWLSGRLWNAEVKGWSSRRGLSQLCHCQAPARPRLWDRKDRVSISQERERFNFLWFPEDRSWHTLGLPITVLRWGRFLSGTGGTCQVLWKPPLAKSLWDGSFPFFAGPFLRSCLDPGQGLCLRATFAWLPNSLFWSLCLFLALFPLVGVCLEQAAFAGADLGRCGSFLPFLRLSQSVSAAPNPRAAASPVLSQAGERRGWAVPGLSCPAGTLAQRGAVTLLSWGQG